MLQIFINGKWVSQEKEHSENYGNFDIVKYHEYHIGMIDELELYPSEIASKIIGLNVHSNWGIKGSTNGYVSDDEVKNDFQKIVQAYPEFLSIKLVDNEMRFMNDVVAGCISKFNYEDIKYYCEVPFKKRKREIEKRLYELYEKINFHFSWVCSPSTLEKIERHVEKNNTFITLEIIKEKLSETAKRHKTEQRLVV